MQKADVLLIAVLCSGCAAVPPPVQRLGNYYQQVLYVRSHAAGSPRASVDFWEMDAGQWQRVINAPAVIGRHGMALSGEKKEGDGKTPSGLYTLGLAFGYAPDFSTQLAYRQSTVNDFWVDDPASAQYNQWVRGTPEAKSFEKMKRDDNLYEFGAVIEYNTGPVVSGAGSAIFMHIWRRYDHPTAGCVALSERHLRKMMKRLNKDRHPVIILEAPHG